MHALPTSTSLIGLQIRHRAVSPHHQNHLVLLDFVLLAHSYLSTVLSYGVAFSTLDSFTHMSDRISHPRCESTTSQAQSNTDDKPDAYQYESIIDATHEIRLMTLFAGEFSDPIYITLAKTPFTQDDIPIYEALSYTWGSQIDPVEICVGESPRNRLHITKNLAEALPYLRYKNKSRVLWIDAICVDQYDLNDRSHQVLRMADIYSKAARVIVWLGPESEDGAGAIGFLKTVASHIKVDWFNHIMISVSHDATWTDRRINLQITNKQERALERFLARPWFERLWIWQEIRLAPPNSIVMYGYQTILWQDVRSAAFCIYNKGFVDGATGELYDSHIRLYELCSQPQYTGILDLIKQTEYAKCADPRDRIYALLSMRNRFEKDLVIIPDYSKSFSSILHDFVSQYIRHTGRLEVLRSVRNNTQPSLPSWVPDWSIASTFSPQMMTNAGLLFPNQFSFSGKMLAVEGLIISSLTCVCPFNLSRQMFDHAAVVSEIKRGCVAMGFDKECASRSETLKTFCKTLIVGRTEDSFYPPSDNYPKFNKSGRFVHDLLRPCWDSTPERLKEEEVFIREVHNSCTGGALFLTQEGQMGLAPNTVDENDLLVIIIGCSTPIILRPTVQNQYLVVGQAYCHGYMIGEALLGDLPHPFEFVQLLYDEDSGGYRDGYINRETGVCQAEDPRLDDLPEGWKRKRHEREHLGMWFVNGESGGIMVSPQDPRLSHELFRKRGVEIREFELV